MANRILQSSVDITMAIDNRLREIDKLYEEVVPGTLCLVSSETDTDVVILRAISFLFAFNHFRFSEFQI